MGGTEEMVSEMVTADVVVTVGKVALLVVTVVMAVTAVQQTHLRLMDIMGALGEMEVVGM
jgi:hypothetical protein